MGGKIITNAPLGGKVPLIIFCVALAQSSYMSNYSTFLDTLFIQTFLWIAWQYYILINGYWCIGRIMVCGRFRAAGCRCQSCWIRQNPPFYWYDQDYHCRAQPGRMDCPDMPGNISQNLLCRNFDGRPHLWCHKTIREWLHLLIYLPGRAWSKECRVKSKEISTPGHCPCLFFPATAELETIKSD